MIREEQSAASKICRAAFCLYFVFVLVGPAAPFQDRDPDEAVGGSNPINQVVDSVVPLVCLFCLWPMRRRALDILKQEKYLVAFLAWCAITVIWSDVPFSSLKGSVRVVGSTIVALAFLAHARSADDALKYIRAILAIYIPITFLAIATVSGATQWEWPAWRGLTAHKNTLGEIALISTIVWAAGFRGASAKGKMWRSAFVIASIVLIFGSKSVTALATLLLIAFAALAFMAARSLGPALATSAAGSFCVIGLLVLVNVSSVEELVSGVGKDTTFTGRTDLWQEMVDEAAAHPLIGAGFSGFWTADTGLRVYAADGSSWRPKSGHQGYLDLWNETGLVGAFLFVLMVVFYFRNAARFGGGPDVWKLLFLSVLIANMMESTFFRVGSFAGWVFILSYLALYADRTQPRSTGLVLVNLRLRRS